MQNNLITLDSQELEDINGGIAIEICEVVFIGWKAVALISAGVTTLAGSAALGIYNGYKGVKN